MANVKRCDRCEGIEDGVGPTLIKESVVDLKWGGEVFVTSADLCERCAYDLNRVMEKWFPKLGKNRKITDGEG